MGQKIIWRGSLVKDKKYEESLLLEFKVKLELIERRGWGECQFCGFKAYGITYDGIMDTIGRHIDNVHRNLFTRS
jgi:hypothetical protein